MLPLACSNTTRKPAEGSNWSRISSRRSLLLGAYFTWTTLLFVGKMKDGFEARDASRLITLLYFALFAAAFSAAHARVQRWRAKDSIRFVLLGLASALLVEAAFMFSQPINRTLTVDTATSPLAAVGYTLADWVIVAPIYVAFYALLWQLLKRFEYSFWQVFFLTAVASFLGEARWAVVANPLLAVVAGPYFFIVYHCRDMPAYLLMRDRLAFYPRVRARRQYVYMVGLAAVFWAVLLLVSL